MHVFCDESGGIAPGNHHFTMAAVVLDPDHAIRALKTFRKALKLPKNAEVKGSSLQRPADRTLFFKILAEGGAVRGGAVICARGSRIGDWATSTFQGREGVLFRHMLVEAFEALPLTRDPRGITIDKGRYKHTLLEAIKAQLSDDVYALTGRRIPLDYGDSASIAGLQIVDVLANTAGRIAAADQQSEIVNETLNPLRAQCGLQLCEARISRLAPEWVQSIAVV